MSQTHTSYEVSKRLKEFLGDNAPDPLSEQWYTSLGTIVNNGLRLKPSAYQLHDLLSKSFCEAMEKASTTKADCLVWKYILAEKMGSAYFNDGFPGVERLLMEMMK